MVNLQRIDLYFVKRKILVFVTNGQFVKSFRCKWFLICSHSTFIIVQSLRRILNTANIFECYISKYIQEDVGEDVKMNLYYHN